MPKENRSKYAILGMLADCPMSGYDIRKHAAHSVSHFWKEDYGHIYPTLKLLVDEGLATRVEEPASPGKPSRHVYTVTEEGRDALAAWLEEMPNPPNLRVELLLKVFFGSMAEPERLALMLEAQAKACETSLKQLEETEVFLRQAFVNGGEEGRAARFQLATLDYGKSYYETFAAWCRRSLESLGAAALPRA
jgi:DNA-binding PadR family transcriptional regulator